ncbi:hypothetical protein XcodCFBP4690_21135 [Xanthomonas codiaei]|uniref:Uncharacterized protein n=1 Tax=Xanthomonas codiaei TaxID=56463 RepID=A0A2S7C5V7_9XANT|nr:hypothetical protein XcodCFBP4690_21135 [Xanthomonas codiaei]
MPRHGVCDARTADVFGTLQVHAATGRVALPGVGWMFLRSGVALCDPLSSVGHNVPLRTRGVLSHLATAHAENSMVGPRMRVHCSASAVGSGPSTVIRAATPPWPSACAVIAAACPA